MKTNHRLRHNDNYGINFFYSCPFGEQLKFLDIHTVSQKYWELKKKTKKKHMEEPQMTYIING